MKNAFSHFLEFLTPKGREQRTERTITELDQTLSVITTKDNRATHQTAIENLLKIGSTRATHVVLSYGTGQIDNIETWPLIVAGFEQFPSSPAQPLLNDIIQACLRRIDKTRLSPEAMEVFRKEIVQSGRTNWEPTEILQLMQSYGMDALTSLTAWADYRKFALRTAECLRHCGGEPPAIPDLLEMIRKQVMANQPSDRAR